LTTSDWQCDPSGHTVGTWQAPLTQLLGEQWLVVVFEQHPDQHCPGEHGVQK